MPRICPQCGKCTVEYDPRHNKWKCYVSSCSWSAEDLKDVRSEYKNDLAMAFGEKLANGSKPSPTL
jgi:hypothetical protein